MNRSCKTLGMAIAVWIGLVSRTFAATWVVTTTADSGPGSLRAAIDGSSPGDSISFALAWPAEIALTTGQLLIAHDLTINGPGAPLVTVKRESASLFRIFEVAANVNASISGLTVLNGDVGDYGVGGGIYSRGRLTATNTIVRGNRSAAGGGIYALGELTLVDSSVVGNTVNAWYTYAGGGGLLFWGGGHLTLLRSTVAQNVLLGWSESTAIGVYNLTGTFELRAVNSTIDGTLSTILGTATMEFESSTLSSDVAGAALFTESFASSGTTRTTIRYRNSIFRAGANRVLGGRTGDTTKVSLGYNIFSDDSGNLTEPTDHPNTNPQLGPLQIHGGLTMTFALLSGSPAVDAGSCTDSAGTTITTDQQGRDRGSRCDIGAFETATAIDVGIENLTQMVGARLDDTISSRASQQSVYDLGNTLTAAIKTRASGENLQTLQMTAGTINTNLTTLVLPAIESRASQDSVTTLSGDVSDVSDAIGAVSTLVQHAATDQSVTALGERMATLEQTVRDALSAISSQTAIDALADLTTRLAIERAISDSVKVVAFMLPQASGGHLEVVRDIVDNAINAMRPLTGPAKKARDDFNTGDAAYGQGQYRLAYAWYVSAYQWLIREGR